MNLFGTSKVQNNVLNIGEIDVTNLAKEFKTPLYIMDEELIRNNCKRYYNSFKCAELKNRVAYAGKAFLTLAMCKLLDQEGLCLDVVSGGELYTAYTAGFPMENIYFHGNNKTLEEVDLGVKLGVGTFVVDNFYEIENLNTVAKVYGKTQRIYLRITPGIEAHTHEYIKTGQIDSKFGFTGTGEAEEVIDVVKRTLALEHIELSGLHCHIGSQIFETEPYRDAAEVMLGIIKRIKTEVNYDIKELDLGGGFGIYYNEEDKPKEFEEYTEVILNSVNEFCEKNNMEIPLLTIEPGRSIVGNAGTTLYTVGSIKDIPEIRKYVAVDGGMGDNIRPALYNAKYDFILANKVVGDEHETVAVAGKCCESGDILIDSTDLPVINSGDLLAVQSTGAYGYSMSNNYNKIPRPAVVFVKNGKAKLVCKRESYEDVIKNEIMI